MWKKLLVLSSLGCTLISASAKAETVTLARAAELTCHRIERLITLKKIPVNFLNQIASVQVQALTPANPGDPVFKAVASLVPGANGQAQQLELLLNEAGKALPNPTIVPGPDSVNAPVWPEKDPVTLIENALHYVLDNSAVMPHLKPFLIGLTVISLSQVTDSGGKIVAKAEIHSSETKAVLEVIIKTDGNFAAARVIE